MPFQIPIVNDKDEFIEYKRISTLTKKDIYRVSALWMINSKGEILLAQRAMNKRHHPGEWGPAVSGIVEKGQTYEENMVQEIEEELGLKSLELRKAEKVMWGKEYRNFVQWFHTTLDLEVEDFDFPDDEVMAVKWITKEELKKELEKSSEKYLSILREFV